MDIAITLDDTLWLIGKEDKFLYHDEPEGSKWNKIEEITTASNIIAVGNDIIFRAAPPAYLVKRYISATKTVESIGIIQWQGV